MKLNSLFVAGILVAALAFAVPAAKADGLPPGDPIIKAAGAGFDAPAGIITQDFTIASPSGTSPLDPTDPTSSACVVTQASVIVTNSPACQFQNDITDSGNGVDIDALIFELPSVAPASVNCDTAIEGDVSLFGTCSVASDGGDGTIVTFNNGTITYGTIFTLGFEGFTGGLVSSVDANVPEPGVLMLLAIGFLALIGFGVKRSAVRA